MDEVLEIDGEKQPVHIESDSKYSRFLEKDLRYERKSKFRVWVAFLVLVAINICMLLFDILIRMSAIYDINGIWRLIQGIQRPLCFAL